MRNNKKKTFIKIIGSLFAILVIICMLISNYMTNYALGRSGDGGNRKVKITAQVSKPQEFSTNKEHQLELTKAFLATHEEETITVQTPDNLRLKGFVFRQNPKPASQVNNQKNNSIANKEPWVLIIHGYRTNHQNMYDYAQRYFAQGYNVLLPDLRGCGESEGQYIGMGYLDKDDMKLWLNYIKETDPESKIIVQGISMGAATAMLLSAETDKVSAYIEEAGYTDIYEIFKNELKLRFHLPSFPILDLANEIAKIKAHYSFKLASPIKALPHTKAPMLFIHGTADNFIPFTMLDELYDAKPGSNKSRLIVKDAGHSESRYVLGEAFWQAIFEFIDKNP